MHKLFQNGRFGPEEGLVRTVRGTGGNAGRPNAPADHSSLWLHNKNILPYIYIYIYTYIYIYHNNNYYSIIYLLKNRSVWKEWQNDQYYSQRRVMSKSMVLREQTFISQAAHWQNTIRELFAPPSPNRLFG